MMLAGYLRKSLAQSVPSLTVSFKNPVSISTLRILSHSLNRFASKRCLTLTAHVTPDPETGSLDCERNGDVT